RGIAHRQRVLPRQRADAVAEKRAGVGQVCLERVPCPLYPGEHLVGLVVDGLDRFRERRALSGRCAAGGPRAVLAVLRVAGVEAQGRSEEHTSELQSLRHLVCRLLLEKKKEKSKFDAPQDHPELLDYVAAHPFAQLERLYGTLLCRALALRSLPLIAMYEHDSDQPDEQ